jgi:hypothetical protein
MLFWLCSFLSSSVAKWRSQRGQAAVRPGAGAKSAGVNISAE